MFSGVEAFITGFCDEYPRILARRREIFVAVVICVYYVGSLPTVTYGGTYVIPFLRVKLCITAQQRAGSMNSTCPSLGAGNPGGAALALDDRGNYHLVNLHIARRESSVVHL
ncbi:sodium:neurotransmitter symporter family domain-containing protein [Ditylenchus destructor]|uniref:Sodium:neurotransmitter symporter family domain-containing protein n=1 Tax=Ditylenchus destructor TaxID=166010 RepID=A0AAD4QUY2_9BILA|nr:sodium:neurotransmitter symporter family domain-containing protein [Ditylenchus destructor]